MNEYIGFEDLKDYMMGRRVTTTSEADEILKTYCEASSRMFDGSTFRKFYPRTETRYFDMPWDDRFLQVDDDLLAVTTFTTQNDDVTVTSAQYFLMCGGSYNLTPYNRLVLKSDGSRPNLLWSGTLQKSQKVIGTWGYHEDWSNAWQDSNDTVQDAGGVNATVTTVTVSNVGGADIFGLSPRFKAQMLLQIDSEYLYMSNKNPTANTLTVRRGVNGTTAATHDNGATINVYKPMVEISHAARRLAKWLYEQRQASYTQELGSVSVGGILRIPEAAPVDVRLAAMRFRRLEIG